jgi:hypothetical protein
VPVCQYKAEIKVLDTRLVWDEDELRYLIAATFEHTGQVWPSPYALLDAVGSSDVLNGIPYRHPDWEFAVATESDYGLGIELNISLSFEGCHPCARVVLASNVKHYDGHIIAVLTNYPKEQNLNLTIRVFLKTGDTIGLRLMGI